MRDVRSDTGTWDVTYDEKADALQLTPTGDITLQPKEEQLVRLTDFDTGGQTLRAIFVAEISGVAGLENLVDAGGSYKRLIACSVHWQKDSLLSLPLQASIDRPGLLVDHDGWKPGNELVLTLLNTADCDWLACPAGSKAKAGDTPSHRFPGGVEFQLELPSAAPTGNQPEAAGSVIDKQMSVDILDGEGWEVVEPGSQQSEKRWIIRTLALDKPRTVLGTQAQAALRIGISGLRALSEGQTFLGVRCVRGCKFGPWSVKLPLLKRTFYETQPGTIVMWSGSITQVPKGWQLCDGSKMPNGKNAPDLRDRFVCGSGLQIPHMNAGDYTRVTISGRTSDVGDHSHTVSFDQREKDSGFGRTDTVVLSNSENKYTTSAEGRHNHSFNFGELPEIRPKWFALAFIIKTGDC